MWKNGLQSVTGIRKCNGITNSGDTDGWGRPRPNGSSYKWARPFSRESLQSFRWPYQNIDIQNCKTIISDICQLFSNHYENYTLKKAATLATPVLPLLLDISDICEFLTSITLFTNSMWKSWLLVTKLAPCVTFGCQFHHKVRAN